MLTTRFATVILVAFATCYGTITYGQTAPAIQSVSTAIGISGSATVNKPAGTVSGDLLIASLALEKGSDATITPPSGWTLICRTNNGTDNGMGTFYKIAGDSEPASYQFTLTGQKWSAAISRVTGFNSLQPIEAFAGRTGNPGNVIAPSVVTTTSNALVLAFYTNKKGATYTPASGTTESYDVPNGPGGGPSHMMAYFTQATAGATGNRTATPNETEKWSAQQIAISAAPVLPEPGAISIIPLETGCQIRYQGLPGLTYQIEYTNELLPEGTEWHLLEEKVADLVGAVLVEDTYEVPMRFYRAVLLE